MIQAWVFVCSMSFHFGKKLWQANREVKMLAGVVLLLMALSMALRILFSPTKFTQIVNMPQIVTMKVIPRTSSPPKVAPVVKNQPAEEIHLQFAIENPPEKEEPLQKEPPKMHLSLEPKAVKEEPLIEIETPQFMKLCLKDKKLKLKLKKDDPVKTIKMTLCDGGGKTLFEESTQFHVGDAGTPPTLILTTSPIPIDNY